MIIDFYKGLRKTGAYALTAVTNPPYSDLSRLAKEFSETTDGPVMEQAGSMLGVLIFGIPAVMIDKTKAVLGRARTQQADAEQES